MIALSEINSSEIVKLTVRRKDIYSPIGQELPVEQLIELGQLAIAEFCLIEKIAQFLLF